MKSDMEIAIASSPLERLDALKNWERGPRSRMEPTIAPMRDLMGRLGNPHHAFAAIHVTGTKGKGSVCALLEAALHEAGFRVGRYASPHVDSISERVSLRRKPVQEARLIAAIEQVLDVRDQGTLAGTPASDATWFDVFTAAAFVLFAHEKLDWVVVEVGLGGRLDSTNVVDGKVCVITNIGLEHTDVLGTTEAAIAMEKAGIVKRGSHVVTAALPGSDAGDVIRTHAAEAGATLVGVTPPPGITAANLAIARAVLDSMGRLGITAPRGGAALAGAQLDDSLARCARLPGRLERWSLPVDKGYIPLLIDGAHVDIALAAVLE
jgi:dihydrofolate synthase/folylpolyglutamate synthase